MMKYEQFTSKDTAVLNINETGYLFVMVFVFYYFRVIH